MLTTPLCHQLGITYPIFSVGMGALAGPELAAAVSNAGACGVLGRVAGAPASHLRQQIQRMRTLTDKPFGVNIILARLQEEWIDVCFAEQVPLLVFFWGDPAPYIPDQRPIVGASRCFSRSAPSRKPTRRRSRVLMPLLPRA